MTFSQIVDDVANRLNLSSQTEALTRIGVEVNQGHRRLTSTIGLQTSRRVTVSGVTASGSPHVTFSGIQKIEDVHSLNALNRRVLGQISYDQWRNYNVWNQAPVGDAWNFAVYRQAATEVGIVLDQLPNADGIVYYADGLENAATLSGTDEPLFPEDYHDALIYAACYDELMKMGKPGEARVFKEQYEQRVSDLRMFIAKSAYLQITQGGNTGYGMGAYYPGLIARRYQGW